MTNTVFIDRALIVIPVSNGDIPDEYYALEMTKNGTIVPGLSMGEPKLPSHVQNITYGIGTIDQCILTKDPKLEKEELPPYPPLPITYDGAKIEETRRTVLLLNVDSSTNTEEIIDFCSKAGEVKYLRPCKKESDETTHMLVEYTAKSNEAAQKEIEEAMSRFKEAQNMINASIEPVIGMLTKDKRTSRRSRSRSRGRRRRSRSRSRSRRRSRSRDVGRQHLRGGRSLETASVGPSRGLAGVLPQGQRGLCQDAGQDQQAGRHRSRSRGKSRDRKKSKSRERSKDRKRSRDRDRKSSRERESKEKREIKAGSRRRSAVMRAAQTLRRAGRCLGRESKPSQIQIAFQSAQKLRRGRKGYDKEKDKEKREKRRKSYDKEKEKSYDKEKASSKEPEPETPYNNQESPEKSDNIGDNMDISNSP
nr:unnamed protein product [Callosobruchus chinensis]